MFFIKKADEAVELLEHLVTSLNKFTIDNLVDMIDYFLDMVVEWMLRIVLGVFKRAQCA